MVQESSALLTCQLFLVNCFGAQPYVSDMNVSKEGLQTPLQCDVQRAEAAICLPGMQFLGS